MARIMKPKTNYTDQPVRDQCQTPPYAVEPLLPYLRQFSHIWEPACGEGYLSCFLSDWEYRVSATDILQGIDFFEYEPESYDVIITNPPYSIKYKWLQRCYDLGKPFALLMPLETLGAQKAQKLFRKHGMELLVLDKRVNFKMPNIGWNGSSAQFPVAWFTYKFNTGKDITYVNLNKDKGELL